MEGTAAVEKLHERDEYAAQQTAQDIRNMGGLREKLPWTFWTYSVGYLALAGIVPFAGFWSKDEILAQAMERGNLIVYGALTLAAFLTAFYMTRQWLLVFFGAFRGEKPVAFVNPEPAPRQIGHDDHHAADENTHSDHSPWHESPTMTAALVVLASFALTAGFFNLPFNIPGGFWLARLWGQEPAEINWLVAGVSLLLEMAGIAAGWYAYRSAFGAAQDTDPLAARAPGLFRLLNEKYRIDELYAASFGRLTSILALAWALIDSALLDGIVNGVGRLTLFLSRVNFIIDDTLLNDGPDALAGGTNAAGRQTRRLQTGKAQDYVAYVFAGALALAMLYLYVLKK
jgi:NADH-quinone oxidoreductase subunit L